MKVPGGEWSTLRVSARGKLFTVFFNDQLLYEVDECVAANGQNLIPPNARGLGFVFQDLALWPHLTVAGQLDFVLASAGVSKRERAERRDEILRLVQIAQFASKYPHQLSGGEQQRAALARALVARPRLLLLDEPMSSLDADLEIDLLKELGALQQSLRVTTIYITHDRAEAQVIARRVVTMRNGHILQTISNDE